VSARHTHPLSRPVAFAGPLPANDPMATTIRQALDERKRKEFAQEFANAMRRQRGIDVVEHGRPE
jgi:hypothetical protein